MSKHIQNPTTVRVFALASAIVCILVSTNQIDYKDVTKYIKLGGSSNETEK